MVKKVLSLIILSMVFINTLVACNLSTATLISQSQSGCNSTFVIQVCSEYLGLEGPPDALSFTFNCGVTVASGFSPANYATSSGDIYTGVRSGSVLTYSTTSVFIAHGTSTLCVNFTITTTGHPTSVVIDTHPGNGAAVCFHTLALNGTSAPAVSPVSICTNSTATLTATGCSGTVNWYTVATGGSAVGTGSSFTTPTLAATTTYYAECVCPSGTCASTRTAVVVTVGGTPVTVSGGPSICSGTPATLVATGGSTYLWSGGQTTSSITANTAGSYSVTVTNSGCTATASLTLAVNPNPVIAFSSNSPICAGGSIQLSASGAATYTWTSSAGGAFSATGSAIDRDNATTAYSGTYNLVATDSNGCQAIGTLAVTVNSCPEICGNGFDDDNDGSTDAADSDCPCNN